MRNFHFSKEEIDFHYLVSVTNVGIDLNMIFCEINMYYRLGMWQTYIERATTLSLFLVTLDINFAL